MKHDYRISIAFNASNAQGWFHKIEGIVTAVVGSTVV